MIRERRRAEECDDSNRDRSHGSTTTHRPTCSPGSSAASNALPGQVHYWLSAPACPTMPALARWMPIFGISPSSVGAGHSLWRLRRAHPWRSSFAADDFPLTYAQFDGRPVSRQEAADGQTWVHHLWPVVFAADKSRVLLELKTSRKGGSDITW